MRLRFTCVAAMLMAAGCQAPAVMAPRNASLLFDRVPPGIPASSFGRKPWPTAIRDSGYEVRERLHIHEHLGGRRDGFSYHRDQYMIRKGRP